MEIAKLLVDKDELTKQSELNGNSIKELEALSAKYKSLEANLTAQSAAQKSLKEENQALQSKIDELNRAIQESREKAKLESSRLLEEKSQVEALLKEQEAQLTQEKAATAAALLTAQEAKAKVDTFEKEKAKAQAKQEAKSS